MAIAFTTGVVIFKYGMPEPLPTHVNKPSKRGLVVIEEAQSLFWIYLAPVNRGEVFSEIPGTIGDILPLTRFRIDAEEIGLWASLLEQPSRLAPQDTAFDDGFGLQL